MKTRADLNLDTFKAMRVLEEEKETNFNKLLQEFQILGGRIEPGVILEFVKDSKEFTINGEINLSADATIYPVCEAGENRSQILALMLKQEHPELKIDLPHGAKGSVDPFILPTKTASELESSESSNWERELAHQFYPLLKEPLYKEELKVERVSRIGEAELESYKEAIQERSIKELKIARDYMDQNYFTKIINNGGYVIAFNLSVHIMMARLVEVAKIAGKRLDNVMLYPIQCDDPAVLKAYRPFYNILNKTIKVIPTLCQKDENNHFEEKALTTSLTSLHIDRRNSLFPTEDKNNPMTNLNYQDLTKEFQLFLQGDSTKEARDLLGITAETYWDQLRAGGSGRKELLKKYEQPPESQKCLVM